jgi:transposase
VDTPDRTKVR